MCFTCLAEIQCQCFSPTRNKPLTLQEMAWKHPVLVCCSSLIPHNCVWFHKSLEPSLEALSNLKEDLGLALSSSLNAATRKDFNSTAVYRHAHNVINTSALKYSTRNFKSTGFGDLVRGRSDEKWEFMNFETYSPSWTTKKKKVKYFGLTHKRNLKIQSGNRKTEFSLENSKSPSLNHWCSCLWLCYFCLL